MTFFAPLIAAVAIRFGPPENFALMVLGLVCTLFMISGSTVKGVLMMALGFLAASVGIDVVNGQERFTFGSINLTGGIELLALVIGLFGVTEVLGNVETLTRSTLLAERIRGLWPTLADWRDSWRPMLRGSGLGFILGLVPGGGPVTASFMSYALEKRISATPSRFGKGAIEGVAGPESANNAAVAGSIIPVLSLGIPGNPVTALLLGALIIHGRAARPAVHDPATRPVLGHRRQHVCRQRVPAGAQPAAGRPVGTAVAHSLSGAVPDRAAAVRGRHLFGQQERVRPVGHARLRHRRLCAAQARLRSRAARHRLRAGAPDGAIAAPVPGRCRPMAL